MLVKELQSVSIVLEQILIFYGISHFKRTKNYAFKFTQIKIKLIWIRLLFFFHCFLNLYLLTNVFKNAEYISRYHKFPDLKDTFILEFNTYLGFKQCN